MVVFFSSLYRTLVAIGDRNVPPKLRPLWEHPAGPKTVHFYAPGVKWCLVVAGLGDLQRPAEKLSIYQSTALALTGTIWARYSLIIIPRNVALFLVNLFVGITGYVQLSRAMHYRYMVLPKLQEEGATTTEQPKVASP